MDGMRMDMDLDMANFSLSSMTIPIPGMEDMSVKTVLQEQLFHAYAQMKSMIEMKKEQGVTAEDLPMIREMEEGGIKDAIIKMFKHFLNDLNEAQSKAKMVQESLKERNPYVDKAESYANSIGKMFEEQKVWDESHEALMCMYDAIADGEMAEMLEMYFPREEVESHSKRLHTALHTILKSPYLGEAVRNIAQGLHEELMSMDVDAIFEKVESIATKLKDRAVEIPFEKIIFLAQEMWRKTWEMLMIGEAPELEKFVDSIVFMTFDETLWQAVDMEV